MPSCRKSCALRGAPAAPSFPAADDRDPGAPGVVVACAGAEDGGVWVYVFGIAGPVGVGGSS